MTGNHIKKLYRIFDNKCFDSCQMISFLFGLGVKLMDSKIHAFIWLAKVIQLHLLRSPGLTDIFSYPFSFESDFIVKLT